MPRIRLIHAVNQALAEEMRRDERVIVIGEDVEASIFGDTAGLLGEFGPDRIRNTPISEASLTGIAVGAAACGLRIVLHMMFANFLYTGFDAIANQMAKLRLMTGGQISLPITIVANYGAGRSTAAQHSDTPFPLLMNPGGIKVAAPATPADAKGLLKSAIRSSDPTAFFEPGGRGGEFGEVPEGDHLVEFGKAECRLPGSDLTLVAIGSTLKPAMQAAAVLAESGKAAEVIDCRTLVPLDEATILSSVSKTGRLVVADESRDCCSAASHIAAIVAERGFKWLTGPIRRVTVPDTAIPYAPAAEQHVMPTRDRIIDAALKAADLPG